jgi:hypothetical protein
MGVIHGTLAALAGWLEKIIGESRVDAAGPNMALLHRQLMEMVCNPAEDYLWRLYIDESDSVIMEYIGSVPITTDRKILYPCLDMCPEWVKDRVAVLYMLPPNPIDSIVFGVGRRTGPHSFWIVAPGE